MLKNQGGLEGHTFGDGRTYTEGMAQRIGASEKDFRASE